MRRRPRPRRRPSPPREVSVESNCMAVTLFCLDVQHESRAADFFAAMFQLWPDKEAAW